MPTNDGSFSAVSHWEFAVADGFSELADLQLKLEGSDARSSSLVEYAANIREARFSIVVVGGFSAGKSALINAMLGREILIQDAIPSTAVPTRVRYGAEPKVEIMFGNGRSSEQITVEEYWARYRLPISDETAANAEDLSDAEMAQFARGNLAHVTFANISYPLPMLNNRVELIDVPGFSNSDTESELARRFIAQAQAVIFVMNASHLLPESDRDEIRLIRQLKPNSALFFIANKWDQVRPREADNVEKRMRLHLDGVLQDGGRSLWDDRVFRTNALGAMDAREASPTDESSLQRSGLPAFEEVLERFLVRERLALRVADCHARLRTARAEIAGSCNQRLARADQPVEKLENERQALEPELEKLRRSRDLIADCIESEMHRIHGETIRSLRTVLQERSSSEKLATELSRTKKEIDKTFGGLKAAIPLALIEFLQKKEDKLKNRLERSVQADLKVFMTRELEAWRQHPEGGLHVQKLGTELYSRIEKEAERYKEVLDKIEDLTGRSGHAGEDDSENAIRELIAKWMKAGGGNLKNQVPAFNPAQLGLDLAPLIGAVAIDFGAHLVGHALPIVGTVIAGLFTLLRQNAQGERVYKEITKKVSDTIAGLPSHADADRMLATLSESFDGLSQIVITNINRDIAGLQADLDQILEHKLDEELGANEEKERVKACGKQADETAKRLLSKLAEPPQQ